MDADALNVGVVKVQRPAAIKMDLDHVAESAEIMFGGVPLVTTDVQHVQLGARRSRMVLRRKRRPRGKKRQSCQTGTMKSGTNRVASDQEGLVEVMQAHVHFKRLQAFASIQDIKHQRA
jgi:hypothetical protein